jgi:hypothetical protein
VVIGLLQVTTNVELTERSVAVATKPMFINSMVTRAVDVVKNGLCGVLFGMNLMTVKVTVIHGNSSCEETSGNSGINNTV